MPDHPEPPRPPSRVRTGLRLLAWFLPGLTAPGFLLLSVMFTYGRDLTGVTDDLINAGVLTGFVLLTIGCGMIDALFRLPPRNEDESARPKRIGLHVAGFTLAQVPLAPLIGIGVATACTSVVTMF